MEEEKILEFIRNNLSFEIDIKNNDIYWYLTEESKPTDIGVTDFFHVIDNNTYKENIEIIKKALK